MRAFVLIVLASFWLPTFANAEELASKPGCQLRVATGKKGKGFSRFLRDMQGLCGSQVQLCEVESEGGLQNTVRLSGNEADLGFVQLDTLHTLKQSDDNVASLQAVLPMNSNLLHILARREGFRVQGERSLASLFQREQKTIVVSKLSDLKGLPVAVVGSAQLMARVLDRSFGFNWRFVDLESEEQGLTALNAGRVAGVLYMNGWPTGMLDALARDQGVVLVPFDLPTQAPYQVIQKNYPRLGVYNHTFLAAPNLLVTRPFKPEGMHGQWVSALQRCLIGNLDALQEGAFEPGWKDVKRVEDTYGWPRFSSVPVSKR